MNPETMLSTYSKMVDDALDRALPPDNVLHKNLLDAMRYSLMAGGKRIRPALVLEFCRLCGGNPADALPFACAVEMVHSYSLIHDDLPCMDDDDMRRGRPSCHKVFGETIALLAGDALLSLAFETALSANPNGIAPRSIIRAAHELAVSSGARGMVGGQTIDLESEGQAVSRQVLEDMHRGKTGRMITVSARMGCIAAHASEEAIEAATEFADGIGMVFQIVDDILDVCGDETILGKHTGGDAAHKKTTFVTLLGLDQSCRLAEQINDEAKKALKSVFGAGADRLAALADWLLCRQK